MKSMNDYLTVKDFAKELNVSQQYVYKLLKTKLKPYAKRIDKKMMIHRDAIGLFNDDSTIFSTNSTCFVERNKWLNEEAYSAKSEEINSTNSTKNTTTNATSLKNTRKDNNEVEALRELIEELKRSNEELRKDKENLKKDKDTLLTESYKWQQLFLEERNKNKMLEKSILENDDQNIEVEVNEKENKTEEIEVEEPVKKKWYEFWK